MYNQAHNIYYKQVFVFFTTCQTTTYYMETATILSIFISGLLLGITGYSVYTAFGPVSKELRDPFEEHED